MNATAGGLFCYIRDQQHIYSITLVIPQVNSLFSPFAVAGQTAASLRKFAARRRVKKWGQTRLILQVMPSTCCCL